MSDQELKLRITGEGASAEAALAKVGAASAAMADKADAASKRMSDSVGSVGKAAESTKASFVAVGAAAAAAVAAMTGGEFTRTLAEWDRLNASLNTVTNSMAQATAAGSMLRQFATQTPYDVQQVTEAFIKLKSLGLDASEKSLRSYGNTASAMGKSLTQFIEAVADASTGEFERLKEFGIKASQQNDKVAFTFRGNTVSIKNDAASIVEYLRKIGETDFSKGMANQMNTVGGRLSNLQDQFSNFADFLGNLGARSGLITFFDALGNGIAATQKQLNGLFGSGIQAQIDALENSRAALAHEYKNAQTIADLPFVPGGSMAGTLADLDKRVHATSEALSELYRKRDELAAKSQTDLSAATAAMGSGASAPSAAEAKKAADEAIKQRVADIKASQEAITAQHEAELRENAAWMAKELEEAKDNAAKKLEIEQRYAESNRKLKLEELAAGIETQQLLKKAGADKAESAALDGKILALQQEINAERKIGAIEAETYGLKAKEISEDQRKSLEKLAEAARSAQAQLAAAQGAIAQGGNSSEAKAAADLAGKKIDLDRQVADARAKYADQGAQDQAEASIRAQAAAATELERITRDSTDRQTSYWVGAWEQAGRTMHDSLTGMFEAMLSGQTGSLQGMITSISQTTGRLAANNAAGAFESVASEAINWLRGGTSGPTIINSATGYSSAALPGAAGSFDTKMGNSAAALAAPVVGALASFLTPKDNRLAYMRTDSLSKTTDIVDKLADAVGNLGGWFALAKLIPLGHGLERSLTPSDRRLDWTGHLVGMTTAVPLLGPLGLLVPGMMAPVVKSNVGYSYDSVRGLSQVSRYTQNGAPIEALESSASALSASLLKAEDILGVSLGSFGVGLENRGSKVTLHASGPGGFSYESDQFRITPENMAGQMKLLTTALLKRGEVLKQFDDLMMRSAIKAGEDLSQISENMNSVYKLRQFEGEATGLTGELTKQRSQYMDRQRLIQDYSGGVREGMELYKLDVAYQRQFAAQVGAYQSALSQLAGGNGSTVAEAIRQVDDAARQLRAQNKELEDAAKKSKGKLTYTPVSEAEIETVRQAALARVQTEFLATLRQLSGATVPLAVQITDLVTQFKALTSEAKTAGVSTSTVGAVLAAQFGGLIQSTAAPLLGERSSIASLRARITGADTSGAALADAERALANNTNREAELSLIGQVRQAIETRYGAELSRLQALESAYQRIADYTKGLRLGGLSTLTPAARFSAARSDYADMLGKAKTGDADALANLSGSADAYLQQAQGYYASGSAYQAIFKAVSGDLGALGAKAKGTGNDIASLQASTVAKLDGLDGKAASALGYAQDQLQAGLDTVGALGVLNDAQAKALSEIINMVGQQGVSNLALGALVANLQGQAAAATTASGAATPIGTGGPSTAGMTQSAGFQAAFESAQKGGFNSTDAKKLGKWLGGNLTGQGYNSEDWSLWRAVGQSIETYSQQMSAKGKGGQSERAHGLAAGINAKLPQELRFFATGGLAHGWAMVGERGPELVNFADAGRVYTASQTAQAINQAQGGNDAGRLADAIEKLGRILEASNGKTAGALRGELGRILEAILMGHEVQAETADKVAREVRMGMARKAA